MNGRRGFIILWVLSVIVLAFAFAGVNRLDRVTENIPLTPTPTPECRTNMYNWVDDIDRWEDMYGIPADFLYAMMLWESGGQWCIEGSPVEWQGGDHPSAGLVSSNAFPL